MAITNGIVLPNIFDVDALLASNNWSFLTEGVKFCAIYTDIENPLGPRAGFLHYLPGAKVPSHRHLGFEHILILRGFQLDGEKCYNVGALVIHPFGTEHALEAPEGCVALGIWEKPVEFI